jgi:thiamine-monophosphate kinase
LPEARATWLGAFAAGLYRCADRFDCELIGGDTTRGPLAISITVIGELPQGSAVTRAGARPGDDIWVSGTLGGAALGLRALRDKAYLDGDQLRRARSALDEPEPRIALGLALREVASAMLDISDGLAGDMDHIAAASRVAAHVNVDLLPRFAGLAGQPLETQLSCLLCGGDDYELCFTAARERRAAVAAAARTAQLAVARVGHVAQGEGVHFEDGTGAAYRFPPGFRLQGFDHFG